MIAPNHMNPKNFFKNTAKNTLIPSDRKVLLQKIAQKIADEYTTRTTSFGLNFICTHNSRRSQIAQVWTFFAIDYFHLDKILPYSGGTETTAFHKNTVKTLQKTGFLFNLIDFSHKNPNYSISYKNATTTLVGFSKLHDDASNSKPYIAITTCNHADENCPFIPEAIYRFHLPFVDPKSFDNTEFEEKKYQETNQQIASEVFFIFKKVAELTS